MSNAPVQVVGAAIRKDNTILCAQRGPSKSLAGYWEFPGGKIERGETPEQALQREIKEELLCDIEVGPKICSTQQDYDFGTIELTTFLCSLASGEPALTEHTQLRWIPVNQLSTLDWAPADRKTVENLTTANWINKQENND
ncbi:(deoxy)nucleoside triphosphate pyrophosphohydrolase [Bifidobacterium sp. ESL0682]|uniref:(deoxy)nucleoside triphosphate pyrophosphohydrolase n=1 Tax=Bifidobacterium sp. ESL0682 TaxID=2983212 RepID=UPI0023F87E72|nr:(deoxy)nucleoside triphosphate pyrophosphohydrolase [Bifidobacterium sp. ESL0682]WEV41697.1 (deoxy)nucleoside triphosphate pyrophosphohydrolase [Bifidobacterium sp. ESL0682]